MLKKIILVILILSLSACSSSSPWLNEKSCNNLEGWNWSSDIGACVSKDITNGKGMYTWNGIGIFFNHGNDEAPQTYDNPTPEYGSTITFADFECIVTPNSDTLKKRMQLANLAQWDDLLKMNDKGKDLLHPHALAIADCIDGVKDLDFSSFEDAGIFKPNWSQNEINKRNCYLSGDYQGENDQNNGKKGLDSQCAFYNYASNNQTWAWKTPNTQFQANSHLPTPWEFVESCGIEQGDAFNYDESPTFSWIAAVGHMSGADWSFGARNLGKESCQKQNFEDTGAVNDIYGFRIVVRP